MTQANKAIVAAVIAGLTSLVTDLQGADSNLTFRDWVVVVLAALVAGSATYVVPNYTRGGARREGGYGAVELAIGAVVLIILVVVLLRLL